MSDGHGSAPETPPPGWAAEQPPPYGAPQWAAPGSQPQMPPPPPGQQPPPPPPQGYYQQPPPPGYGYMPPPPPLRPGIIPLRPLTLGDLLDGAIKLIRSNPKAVLGLSAVAALLAAIPVAIGQALLLGDMGSLLTDPTAPVPDVESTYGMMLGSYGATFLSMAISFVLVTLLTGVITRILGRAVFGGKITAGEAWNLVKGRIGALFGVVALLAAIMLAPLVIIIPLFVALATALEGGSGAAGAGGLLLLVVVLYIPYALFFNTRFSFATPAVVLEGRGPIDAMKRSWNLVTGDFWRVLGILLLTALLAGLVSSVLSVPFTLIGTFAGMLGGGSTASAVVSAIMIAIGTTLGAMITYPLQAGVAGLLYTDRRMRSEAFDLVLQTAAIEQQRQGWVPATADELWHPSNAARQ